MILLKWLGVRTNRILALLMIVTCLGATGAGAESPETSPFPVTRTKKGLQPQMIDDAVALRVEHAALNVDLTRLIDPSGNGDGPCWMSAGNEFRFDRSVVAGLDAQVKPLSDAGVVVYLILLPYASGVDERDRLMLHPAYARGEKGTGPIAMFNVVTAEGTAWLRAALEFLAARYDGGNGFGRVWGYIAGNEVNSHWFWANMGRASVGDVADAYEKSVRIIHEAVRTASANARVYLSFEHFWDVRYGAGDERQSIPGREFLDAFATIARRNGDFDWHLAYHPYPEPLTDCRFWLDDKHAPHSDNAQVVSFRNLEVLLRHLRADQLLWQGKPRRVILSEQGFHCTSEPDGERNQAAAYALAYVTVSRLEGIDSFILHRHVDHAHEGGLNLGLWTNQPGAICTPDRKRPMYDVFRAAGTAQQAEVFGFALPIIGASDWEDALRRMRSGK